MSEISSTFIPVFTPVPGRSERLDDKPTKLDAVNYHKAGQEALGDLMSVQYDAGARTPVEVIGRPQLHPPLARDNGKASQGDLFTLLMAMISELLGEVDVNKLKNRLTMLQSLASARQQGHEKLAAKYTSAVAAMEAAEGAVDLGRQQLEPLHERVQYLQRQLTESETRLAGLAPGSPEQVNEVAVRDRLETELAKATRVFEKTMDAQLKLIETANAAARSLLVVARQVEQAGVIGPSISQADEKALNANALALLNRLKIIELLGDAAQNKEELNQALLLELQARLQEKMKVESEKYLEEVRKAEALQKTMGCVGKIVGALVSIASIVAGVLTVNPVLIAVGVIGAAIMIAEEVVKQATGTSFMGEVMKPLTAVMQEAVKLFTELYTKTLMALGVDEKTAKDIGQIAGMIAGIAATLAAIVLTAMVGIKVIGPMLGAIASKIGAVVAQAAPAAVQATRQLASSLGNTLTQMLSQLRHFVSNGADPVTLARYAARVEIAQAVTEFAGVGAQGALGVQSGAHQAQAARHLADVRVRTAINEQITSYLTQVVEDYGKAMQDRSRQIEQVLADQQRSHAVSLSVARNV
ncbi:type III secretion system translocon subunit SctE [Pseudomonas sp. S2_C03]